MLSDRRSSSQLLWPAAAAQLLWLSPAMAASSDGGNASTPLEVYPTPCGTKNCSMSNFGTYFIPGDPWECNWPDELRIVLYALLLIWLFLGVAIIANVFMEGIEEVTSATKTTKDGRRVRVWRHAERVERRLDAGRPAGGPPLAGPEALAVPGVERADARAARKLVERLAVAPVQRLGQRGPDVQKECGRPRERGRHVLDLCVS